jgi:hypothetical protein
MDRPEFPNARLRLRRVATAPGAPNTDAEIVLWLNGPRFHLRDETGRHYSHVLGDVTSQRGFGNTPQTMEDFMNAWTPSERPRRPTEIFADAASDEAVVVEDGSDPWRLSAGSVLALADQVLTRGRELELDAVGERRFLARDCQEYRFSLEGEEHGIPYRTDVEWLVSVPYLLRQELRDFPHGGLSTITEVVELAEGAVAEDDLRFPG